MARDRVLDYKSKRSKPKRVSRLEGVSDEEIAARWKASLVRYVRFLIFFAVATAGIFLYNHFLTPPKNVMEILQVAFQIGLIFTLCFTMLVLMGLYYSRTPEKK